MMDLVNAVYDKLLGADIVSTKVDSDSADLNRYKELCESLLSIIADRKVLREDEYLGVFYSMDDRNGKKWEYKICVKDLDVDDSKDWKCRLNDVDWENLASHGLGQDILCEWQGRVGIADRDDNVLIIRTADSSWTCMCGREWYYNLETKEFTLHRMN